MLGTISCVNNNKMFLKETNILDSKSIHAQYKPIGRRNKIKNM